MHDIKISKVKNYKEILLKYMIIERLFKKSDY